MHVYMIICVHPVIEADCSTQIHKHTRPLSLHGTRTSMLTSTEFTFHVYENLHYLHSIVLRHDTDVCACMHTSFLTYMNPHIWRIAGQGQEACDGGKL
jgi:hypothetical protein